MGGEAFYPSEQHWNVLLIGVVKTTELLEWGLVVISGGGFPVTVNLRRVGNAFALRGLRSVHDLIPIFDPFRW